jgi:hypothetical protein
MQKESAIGGLKMGKRPTKTFLVESAPKRFSSSKQKLGEFSATWKNRAVGETDVPKCRRNKRGIGQDFDSSILPNA